MSTKVTDGDVIEVSLLDDKSHHWVIGNDEFMFADDVHKLVILTPSAQRRFGNTGKLYNSSRISLWEKVKLTTLKFR